MTWRVHWDGCAALLIPSDQPADNKTVFDSKEAAQRDLDERTKDEKYVEVWIRPGGGLIGKKVEQD